MREMVKMEARNARYPGNKPIWSHSPNRVPANRGAMSCGVTGTPPEPNAIIAMANITQMIACGNVDIQSSSRRQKAVPHNEIVYSTETTQKLADCKERLSKDLTILSKKKQGCSVLT